MVCCNVKIQTNLNCKEKYVHIVNLLPHPTSAFTLNARAFNVQVAKKYFKGFIQKYYQKNRITIR